MKNSENDDVLTCFYQLVDPKEISSAQFTFSESAFTQITNIPKIYSKNETGSILKTSVSIDQKIAIIFYTKYYDDGRCFFYNINDNTFTEDTKFSNNCKGAPNAVYTYYYDNNFVFTGNKDKGFKVVLFDGNALEIIMENDFINYTF